LFVAAMMAEFLVPCRRQRESGLNLIRAAANNLQDGPNYENKRKVADLGTSTSRWRCLPAPAKRVQLFRPEGSETRFLSFFDGLLNQQGINVDMENAIRYERLSVPERLDQLDNEIKGGRIATSGLVPLLDKIIQDDRVLQYAPGTRANR